MSPINYYHTGTGFPVPKILFKFSRGGGGPLFLSDRSFPDWTGVSPECWVVLSSSSKLSYTEVWCSRGGTNGFLRRLLRFDRGVLVPDSLGRDPEFPELNTELSRLFSWSTSGLQLSMKAPESSERESVFRFPFKRCAQGVDNGRASSSYKFPS